MYAKQPIKAEVTEEEDLYNKASDEMNKLANNETYKKANDEADKEANDAM